MAIDARGVSRARAVASRKRAVRPSPAPHSSQLLVPSLHPFPAQLLPSPELLHRSWLPLNFLTINHADK